MSVLLRLKLRFASQYDCTLVGSILQQYLDNHEGHRLDNSIRAKLEAHLAKCPDCGLTRDEFVQLKQSLADQQYRIPVDTISRLRAFAEDLALHGEPDGHDPTEP